MRFLLNIFGVGVPCRILYSIVGYLYVSGSEQLPRLGKRELIYLLLFTCNYVVSAGEFSSSSGCLGWATLLAYLSRRLTGELIGYPWIRRPSSSS